MASVVRWKACTLDNRIIRRRIGSSLGADDADRCDAALGEIPLARP